MKDKQIEELIEQLNQLIEDEEPDVDYILNWIFNPHKEILETVFLSSLDFPEFKSKKDIGNYLKKLFKELGTIQIESDKLIINLYPKDADRETMKRRILDKHNKAIVVAFEQIIKTSIYKGFREVDERHKYNQYIYTNQVSLDNETFDVEIYIDIAEDINQNRYDGSKAIKK